ncbi:hypothetical protein G7046_g4968 [Stylonectria norvegica]|nr:hypothetical protein G7046_g4968 [Stylonectria norvegica]
MKFQILHFGCALAGVGFASASFIISLGQLKQKRIGVKRNPRLYAILSGLVILSYLAEGIVTAILGDPFDHSEARITHLVSLITVWLLVSCHRNEAASYELPTTAVITILFELPLLVLFLSPLPRRLDLELALPLACQITRVVILSYFLLDAGHGWVMSRNTKLLDDETRPLLNGNHREQVAGDTAYGTQPLLDAERDGTISSDDTDDAASDSDDEDADVKKLRKKRLRETGGWFGYLKDFSIFIPYLIPRKDRKVQLCILISLLSLFASRVMVVLVPRQLGIVADKLLEGEAPYGALAIWLGLSILSEESGLVLIKTLAKIPIQQFSYRQVTNAAFNHVMALSMEFHAERDSAEVMKAIEQGESLTNLLDTLFIEMMPTVIDLTIAFVLFYIC